MTYARRTPTVYTVAVVLGVCPCCREAVRGVFELASASSDPAPWLAQRVVRRHVADCAPDVFAAAARGVLPAYDRRTS